MDLWYCNNCGCITDIENYDFEHSEVENDEESFSCPHCGEEDGYCEIYSIKDAYEMSDLGEEEFLNELAKILNKYKKRNEKEVFGKNR